MITKVLIAVAVLIAALSILVVLQPSEFRITRSATVAAPPAIVFDQVNDLHKYQTWSPFAKLDPAMQTTFEGPSVGTGAVLAWTGNGKAGEGRMKLSESRPNELVRFDLEFFKPFKATNVAEFTFKPQGDQTVVTWSMSGKNNFMFKAVSLFMNSDKMVGGMFEEGLANLKSIVEAEAKG
ncbi:MAG: SRPBCC family protein [Terrimicrobiaceae bacterium]